MKSLAQQGTTKIELQLKFTKSANMNIYVYGGVNRFEAKTPITPSNAPAEIGKWYTVDFTKVPGMLVVAYPNKKDANNPA